MKLNLSTITSTMILGLCISLAGKAQSIGNINYAGTGCPSDSMALSFDEQGLLLRPRTMLVKSGGSSGKSIDRKSCNLAIPFAVPLGLQVALLVDLSGYSLLKANGKLSLNQELFTTGTLGGKIKKVYLAQGLNKILISSQKELATESLGWSECGKDSILRTNINLLAQGNAQGRIDQIRFQLVARECE